MKGRAETDAPAGGGILRIVRDEAARFAIKARLCNPFLRAVLVTMLFLLPMSAVQASTHKKKSHSGTHSSGKKGHALSGSKHHSSGSKHGASSKKRSAPVDTALQPKDYPGEIGSQVGAYNAEVAEIHALRAKDAKLATARAEVLKIKRDSFDLYREFISDVDKRKVDKIRKAVAAKGWYKGMPQIAFVVSMGLPDDVVSVRDRGGDHLKLIYQKVSYEFEKGELRSIKK